MADEIERDDDGQEDHDQGGQEEREVPELREGEDEAEGDEGQGDDEEGDGEGSVDDAPSRRPSRAESRIQTLRAETKAAKERTERLERELAEFRQEQRARQQQTAQESPEARATRRALMDPMDVMREDLAESERRTANMLREQAQSAQETNDRLTYNGILRDAPHLKKYDAEVEKIRLEQVARGMFVPREVLLDLAIGRAARAAATRQAPKAKAKGQERIAAQQSRTAAPRGDTATARGRQGDSPEKRLENVPI